MDSRQECVKLTIDCLVWLVTEGNLTERELARLIESGLREGCILLFFLLNLIEILLFTGTG
jgi:hypothetical protein